MSFGWTGRILRVDLSGRRSWVEDTEPYVGSFIGGRGINVKILYDEVGPEVTAYSPANRLCLGPGVLTGTLAPSSGRMKVSAVSPHGLMGSAGIGGFIGAEIRHAGYDNVVLEGAAEEPVYVYIHDDEVEFRDAAGLWGEDTQETQELIREELGGSVEVVCIGPAGENLVTFAGVVTGMGSVAGRHGLGAVMGSKNLKAVVVRGTGEIRIARMEEFVAACEEAHRWLRNHPGMRRQAIEGVGEKYTLGSGLQEDPLGNWEAEDASWEEVGSFEGAEEFWDRYAIRQYGCFGCPVNHYHIFRMPGVGAGTTKCMGWAGFTSNVWNNDRRVMFHANYLCNRYGLDVTATGNVISFLMELYHRGLITEEDTDGMRMGRGDEEAIIATIHKVGRQEGFGRLFKDGVLEGARQLGEGAEECAMVVKGEEMEQFDVRAFRSIALAAAVGSGSIAQGLSLEYYALFAEDQVTEWARELYGLDSLPAPTSYENKAMMVWDYENRNTAMDLLGMCQWAIPWSITPLLETPTRLFSLATGRKTSVADLLLAAQKTITLERAFGAMRGTTRAEDTLPGRLFDTAVPGSRFKGERLDRAKFDRMKDEYYALRGWDTNGVPTREAFQSLGLSSEWQLFSKKRPARKVTS